MSRLAARAAVTTSVIRGEPLGEGEDGDCAGQRLVDGFPGSPPRTSGDPVF